MRTSITADLRAAGSLCSMLESHAMTQLLSCPGHIFAGVLLTLACKIWHKSQPFFSYPKTYSASNSSITGLTFYLQRAEATAEWAREGLAREVRQLRAAVAPLLGELDGQPGSKLVPQVGAFKYFFGRSNKISAF